MFRCPEDCDTHDSPGPGLEDPSGLIISSSVVDTREDAVNANNYSIRFIDAHSGTTKS